MPLILGLSTETVHNYRDNIPKTCINSLQTGLHNFAVTLDFRENFGLTDMPALPLKELYYASITFAGTRKLHWPPYDCCLVDCWVTAFDVFFL